MRKERVNLLYVKHRRTERRRNEAGEPDVPAVALAPQVHLGESQEEERVVVVSACLSRRRAKGRMVVVLEEEADVGAWTFGCCDDAAGGIRRLLACLLDAACGERKGGKRMDKRQASVNGLIVPSSLRW